MLHVVRPVRVGQLRLNSENSTLYGSNTVQSLVGFCLLTVPGHDLTIAD